jgi:peptidyl-prolyl cis-trans isomerase SurA
MKNLLILLTVACLPALAAAQASAPAAPTTQPASAEPTAPAASPQTAPAQAAPADTTPVQTAPGQTAPAQTAPAQAAPVPTVPPQDTPPQDVAPTKKSAAKAGKTEPTAAGAASGASTNGPATGPLPPVQPGQGGQVVEEIIARVNNQIVTQSEFVRSKDQLKDEAKQQDAANADKLFAEREKDVLRDLIDQQLLLDKGKDLTITGDTDLIKQLDQMRKEMKLENMEDLEKEAAKQGISWEDFKQNMRNKIITQKVIGEEVGQHLTIAKEEESKFYGEHKNDMEQPESIRLSEILVAPKAVAPAAGTATPATAAANTTAPADANAPAAAAPAATNDDAETAGLAAAEAKANDLLKQIRGGAGFEDIAKKSSDGPSAAEGGALGSFKRGQLAKELEDKTFAMKAGEVTDVIRTKQGYVILKVNDHTMAGIPTLKEVEPKIQDALYYEKLQPALRAYLTKLREEAYIKLMEGYVDTGASPNQTEPVETSALKESDAKKLAKKKKKKIGFIPI